MAKYLVTDTELKSVADAIRTKGGTEEALVFPNGFVSAIETVPGAGNIEPLEVTQNGTYNPPSGVDGYAPVTVNVSGGGGEFIIPIVDASSTYDTSPKQPSGAFGDVAGNFWGASGTSAWFNINFQTPHALRKILLSNYYRLTIQNYWYSSSITVRASNDGFSTYTDLYTGTGLAQSETQFEIDLNNSIEYIEYRLIVYDEIAWVGLGRIVLQ